MGVVFVLSFLSFFEGPWNLSIFTLFMNLLILSADSSIQWTPAKAMNLVIRF
jgi:hypothetical protein